MSIVLVLAPQRPYRTSVSASCRADGFKLYIIEPRWINEMGHISLLDNFQTLCWILFFSRWDESGEDKSLSCTEMKSISKFSRLAVDRALTCNYKLLWKVASLTPTQIQWKINLHDEICSTLFEMYPVWNIRTYNSKNVRSNSIRTLYTYM